MIDCLRSLLSSLSCSAPFSFLDPPSYAGEDGGLPARPQPVLPEGDQRAPRARAEAELPLRAQEGETCTPLSSPSSSSLGVRAAEAHEEQEGQEVQLQPGLPARGQEHLRDLRGQGGRAALRAGRGISLNLLKLRNLNIVPNFHSPGIPPDVHLRGQGEVHGEG